MSALEILRQAQAALADTSSEAHQLVTKAIEQLGAEAERRDGRIDRERIRLMRAGEVLKCLAVAIDEDADVVVSDAVELVAEIVIGATHGLDSTALKRNKTK